MDNFLRNVLAKGFMKKVFSPWGLLFLIAIYVWSSSIWEWRFYHYLAELLSEAVLMDLFYRFCGILLAAYWIAQIIYLKLFRRIKSASVVWRLVISIICICLFVILSSFILPAERIDAVRFLIIGFLAGIVANRFPNKKYNKLIYIAFSFMIPVVNELMQSWVFNMRDGSIKDVITGSAAVGIGFILSGTWDYEKN